MKPEPINASVSCGSVPSSRVVRRADGFALVVTLSLMILLTVIAVGLLSLSAVSMRSSAREDAMQAARANAKMALMLALGDLQVQLGPDTRISATADQLAGSNASQSAAPQAQRQWAGVYDAWPAASPESPRPKPTFRQWLVSGNPTQILAKDFATTAVRGSSVTIVSTGSIGHSGDPVRVPMLTLDQANGTHTRCAWWIGDQGVKAALSVTRAKPPSTLAAVRHGMQGAPRNAAQLAQSKDRTTPFASLPDEDPRLSMVTDFNQAGLLVADPKATTPLFHDLTSHSTGMLTNVRTGGFRKDLSMYLETTAPPTGNTYFPLGTAGGALYQVNGMDGIHDDELWSYYHLYQQLKTGSITFTTGGSGGGNANPYLQAEGNETDARADAWFYYKRPVIIAYKALFSFYVTDPDTSKTPPTPSKLAMCVDPAITYWNPYDVPVSLSPAYNSIRFEKIPYQINGLIVNGVTAGSVNLGGTADSVFAKGDFNYTTMSAGKTTPVVLMPGEVLMVSQGSNTTPRKGSSSALQVDGAPGFNFGGGIYYHLKDTAGKEIDVPSGLSEVTISFTEIIPNNEVVKQGVGGASPISVNHAETYLFADRPSSGTSSVGIGGVDVDFWRGIPSYDNPKSSTDRFLATQKPDVFKTIAGNSFSVATSGNTSDRKAWFFYYGYDIKSESDSLRPGQFLSRFNPSAALVDFADLSPQELDAMPVEVRIIGNSGGDTRPPALMDSDSPGHGYFGGGITSMDGTTFISTHSVPQEPLVSLAALQHSQANGFNRLKPDKSPPYYESSVTNQSIRLPMLPQISHAIGNSLAPPVLAADKTQGMLSNRPLADHSYLANAALWDDWFFSGIAPTSTPTNSGGLTQKQVAQKFLDDTSPLPVARYRPDLGTETPESALNRLISGNEPSAEAPSLSAAFIRVDGLFNVNSTSVQAWKAMLGGLKNHPIITRDATAGNLAQTTNSTTPVTGLLAPADLVSNGSPSVRDAPQWTGRRTLTDKEIDALADKLVEEVRKRGPFISLADFINRRPDDAGMARAGAIQSAIDAAELNNGFASRMASSSSSLAYGAAESGSPSAQGIPGIVKQADILTPIAPVLSVRSDTFIIRGYGESRDNADKVMARACCEAVVERDFEFVDPSDTRETALTALNPVNKRFGRRFSMLSFRWLSPNEI